MRDSEGLFLFVVIHMEEHITIYYNSDTAMNAITGCLWCNLNLITLLGLKVVLSQQMQRIIPSIGRPGVRGTEAIQDQYNDAQYTISPHSDLKYKESIYDQHR